jgi:D-serine dehydratase
MEPVSTSGVTPDLDALLDGPLPPTHKSLPAAAMGRSIRALRGMGLSLLNGDLPLPAAILKKNAHNSHWMRSFTERDGVELCPHGKTTMPP